ncbi:MAG: radical SAM protein [Halobacteriaceae archaeon]
MNTEHSEHQHPHQENYNKAPLIVTWEMTQACDLSCDHCRADANPERNPDELSTEEGKQLIDQIGDFAPSSPILVLSGGDPLKRPDIFELADYATENEISTAIAPAPTPQLDDDIIEMFAEIGIKRMALSLDGGSAETHDAFRGEEGSFNTIRRVCQYANELGIPLQINTTITRETITELPEIADLVETIGAVMWEVFFLVPIGRGKELEQLSPSMAEEVMEWLYNRQKDAPFKLITVEAPHYRRVAKQLSTDESENRRVGSTRAGKGFLFVNHTGEVYPSGFLPKSVGNIRENNIVSIYREAPLLRNLRDADQFLGPCGDCQYRELCGGSRSRAYAMTGDPLESDPLCDYS